ncbi:MAG: hypothetical protein LBV66_00655 [Elusimicrobiota bacterium]|jgi:RNA polymerase subunit RPABC4/transcription elongation factor Spt4|nr:hypothetical protein [Elusimicrobiota bacterium]
MEKKCECPYCETELKNGCLNPKFCKPCSIHVDKNIKVCAECGSQYSAEYDTCPSCCADKKDK